MFAGLFEGDTQRAQLLMVAGFVMLGWVLARRQIGLRKKVNRDARASDRALRKIREHVDPIMPLSDAPPETQRWQVALFDLQRELKADLDTRIVVVQTLLQQVDQRIAHLESLNGGSSQLAQQSVSQLLQAGHSAQEIADQTQLPIGEVELMIATLSPNPSPN